jgi:hypothetical protein
MRPTQGRIVAVHALSFSGGTSVETAACSAGQWNVPANGRSRTLRPPTRGSRWRRWNAALARDGRRHRADDRGPLCRGVVALQAEVQHDHRKRRDAVGAQHDGLRAHARPLARRAHGAEARQRLLALRLNLSTIAPANGASSSAGTSVARVTSAYEVTDLERWYMLRRRAKLSTSVVTSESSWLIRSSQKPREKRASGRAAEDEEAAMFRFRVRDRALTPCGLARPNFSV